MKICAKCKQDLDECNFSKDSSKKDGLYSSCSKCRKEYTDNNKHLQKERDKKHYLLNKEKKTIYRKKYRQDNLQYFKDYEAKHKSNYIKQRKIKDPIYKLKITIKRLISHSLTKNGHIKSDTTVSILGCSILDFHRYIESKFESWMNWQNHGNWNGQPTEINTAWDIDHIIPISSASSEEDVIRLNHYTNFQPLCSFTNRHIKRNLV